MSLSFKILTWKKKLKKMFKKNQKNLFFSLNEIRVNLIFNKFKIIFNQTRRRIFWNIFLRLKQKIFFIQKKVISKQRYLQKRDRRRPEPSQKVLFFRWPSNSKCSFDTNEYIKAACFLATEEIKNEKNVKMIMHMKTIWF